jgi:protoporphyrinogen IX oxidase
MLWIKAFHIIFMVTWFAGLFYLPRLFVYHAMSTDTLSIERFQVMERKLCYGIMTPGAVLTLVFGIWLMVLGGPVYTAAGWMHIKLLLVLILIAYHAYLGLLLQRFAQGHNRHTHTYYRWLNEFPVLILIVVVVLVVVKPL